MDDLQVRLKYKKTDADDWTKVEDKALRKKLQNRLAKRKSRVNLTKGTKNVKGKANKKTEPRDKDQDTPETIAPASEGDNLLPIDILNDSQRVSRTGQFLSSSRIQHGNLDDEVESFLATTGLHEHRFICLSQYSLLRAILQNAKLLALDFALLADDESLSPCTLMNPYPIIAPQDLNPTPLQLCTPHHPYVDIIPSPAFRDNILLLLVNNPLEDQFCNELHCDSFTIWGSQPWDTQAWEVSQTFATNWAWLMDEKTIRSSNFWRGERGEDPLVLPDFGGAALDDMAGGVLGEVF
ncbi:hypothetical protein ABVK25_010051 [Lepraria finkii]|uniref:Uncharacterized protein n=1 Tax=Lepraria finkii TaxID=1340010 RepID=A0ABR4AWQ3_9LECA